MAVSAVGASGYSAVFWEKWVNASVRAMLVDRHVGVTSCRLARKADPQKPRRERQEAFVPHILGVASGNPPCTPPQGSFARGYPEP